MHGYKGEIVVDVNIGMSDKMFDEVPVPGKKVYARGDWKDYAIHDDKNIKGFFGEYRWLSNFYACEVWFDGMMYPSTEAAYQASKTLNLELRKPFTCMSHRDAKKGGNILPLRSDWEKVKSEIMAAVVFDKFYRDTDLRKRLMDTGDKYLEETNHWNDCTWGVCGNKGENRLGKILMNIRSFWKNLP